MAKSRTLTAGEYLFREGESAEYGYVVKSGQMEIVKTSVTGEIVLAELGPGSLFGEMALIDESPRSASARASVESSVTEIRSETFNHLIRNDPDTALRLMKALAGQLRSANKDLAQLSDSCGIQVPLANADIFDEQNGDNEIDNPRSA